VVSAFGSAGGHYCLGGERVFPTNTPGPAGFTYPNPVQLSAEGDRVYLFWRSGNSDPSFSTVDTGSSAWSPARTVISSPGERPYVKYASNDRDTIAMAYTEDHSGSLQTSIYYAAYQAGALRQADGSVISSMADLPIGPSQGEKITGTPTERHGSTTSPWTPTEIR
jgi:hypothetical protein